METVYKLAKALGTSMELLVESAMRATQRERSYEYGLPCLRSDKLPVGQACDVQRQNSATDSGIYSVAVLQINTAILIQDCGVYFTLKQFYCKRGSSWRIYLLMILSGRCF